MKALRFLCGAAMLAATPAMAGDILYHGICDGSAAVALDDGTLLVAYDEKNRLYAVAPDGGGVTRSDRLRKKLGLTDKGETDLEGAARDGDVIWWIGSHGLSGKAKRKPNREVLFATNVPAPDLTDLRLVHPPVNLIPALLEDKAVAAVFTKTVLATAPKQGGLNIEGLAVHPDGGLILGFRAPLVAQAGVQGMALLVHIRPTGDGWAVANVHRLNLGQRGIRDLARDGDDILILAGPVDQEAPFALYRWDGSGGPIPVDGRALDGIRPEALVKSGETWLALSDDGNIPRSDGMVCNDWEDQDKDGPDVFFRGRVFRP